MSKNQDYHYIIQFDNGFYYKGYSNLTDQMRFALMYNSEKQVHMAAKDYIRKFNTLPQNKNKQIFSYSLHIVEINIIDSNKYNIVITKENGQ